MTRRVLLGTIAAMLVAVGVRAQEVPVLRFYVVPKIGTGAFHDGFRPKYTRRDELGPGWQIDLWAGMDYGFEPVFLLAATVTAAQHTTLAAQTDVLSVPVPLDDNVSAVALPKVQTSLEAMMIPGNWVTTTHTYRDVLRAVVKVIGFMQRYQGLFPSNLVFESGITLDTRWNQLTAAQRDRLVQVGASLALDTSGIVNTMTLRQILILVSNQLAGATIQGEVF